MKRLLALLLAIIMVFSIVGCSKNEEQAEIENPVEATSGTKADAEAEVPTEAEPVDTKRGGHLNFVSEMAPTDLDPAKSTGLYKYLYTNLVYETPLTRDGEGNIRPNVCNFEFSEDGLTLKLWVREGVTFHDGSAVEIEDVVASIKRAVHKSPRNYVAAYIKDVQIEDGVATITFTEYLEKTMTYIASVNPLIGVMPKEICEKYSYESELVITDLNDAIGTGPYKFTELIPEVSVSVERYEGYVPVEPGYTGAAAPKMAYMDSITLITNTDQAAMSMALLAGDADLAENISQDYHEQAAAANITRNPLPYTAGLTITFNTFGSNPTSSNADLRKAIVAAIDIPELVNFLNADTYYITGSPTLSDVFYKEQFDSSDYMGEDKAETIQKYLDAAGYNGETITFICPASEPEWATMIESYMRNANINCKIEIMEDDAWVEYYSTATNDWDFYLGFTTLADSPSLLNDNYMKNWYNSEAKDALLAELCSQVTGSAGYLETWDKLATQIVDDCAVVVFAQSKLDWFLGEDLNFTYEGRLPYLYNAYWTNPEEHSK